VSYVSLMINQTPTSSNAEAYAKIVHDLATRRRILQAANDIAKMAFDISTDLEAVSGAGFAAMQSALGDATSSKPEVIGDVYGRVWSQADDASRNEGKLFTPSGFYDLDRMLCGGFRRGDLTIVAARPSVGKSSFLITCARSIAKASQFDLNNQAWVLFCSLEMSKESIASRIISQETGINTINIQNGKMSDLEWPKFTQSLGDSPQHIIIDDTPAITPDALATLCRREAMRHPLSVVMVDYVQLMSAGVKKENRVQEITYISMNLKKLARELNVPIVVAAQLNRAVEQRAEPRPVLSDLRESGSLEQDADGVLFLWRGKDDGVIESELAKHRNGPTGKMQFVFRGANTQFLNAERMA
jgi:replicative DNA helicase